jgi:hypothetical protein
MGLMDIGPGGRGGARRRTRRRMTRRNNSTADTNTGQPQDNANDNQQSNTEELEKLAELKTKGVITEEEFAAKKKQLLGI